jgi:predicted RecB family nuclease
VWLIGGSVVDDDAREPFSLWAEPGEEGPALRQLAAILERHPGFPIVTWNGDCADVPHLRHATTRAGGSFPIKDVVQRHVDAFQYVARSLRLPVHGFGLKEMADYFGISRVSTIRGGLEADFK